MKTLVIAEKPSVGRDIARVMHCSKKGDGCMEGSQYVVTWALGHLVTLQDPEDYNKKYKEWELSMLPIMPDKLKIKVIPKTGKQYHAITKLLFRGDINQVIIATDAGREGELVARWILDKAHNQKPCKRLWISSVTDKAIQEGFAHLKDAREYDNLYHAAVSRAEADWLVGINCTRALTCKYNAQLSCGRVQTPTLAMIEKREEEIRSFTAKPYYMISAEAGHVKYLWIDQKTNSARTFSKERSESIQRKAQEGSLKLTKVDKKEKKTFAPLLYDLTELQRDANNHFGYSAKQTLNIMQRLYETYKLLTYPRTDSRYLTADIIPTIAERLEAISVGPYRSLASKAKQTKLSKKMSFVNDAKVSDHHAIIPTEQFVDLAALSSEERKIYDLVVRRFLSVLYPPVVYEETMISADLGGEIFQARGKRMIKMGWREVYESEATQSEEDTDGLKEQNLPLLKPGEVFENPVIRVQAQKTKPPRRFTEATLLSAMENPVRYMESMNTKMAKTLGETGGLGTVATRADIIEKLFNTFLLEKKENEIILTSKAKQLLRLVPLDLKRPELTASWEMKLSAIAGGDLKSYKFTDEIRNYTKDLVNQIKEEEGSYHHDNLTNKKCPNCGKRLLSVKGKNSKLLVCQDRNCGYREVISRTSNARCPVCHKKMELYGNGEDATFICICGHKERLDKFKERRKKEGGGVSKKDVAQYMKAQKREAQEPVNNAFADALKVIHLN